MIRESGRRILVLTAGLVVLTLAAGNRVAAQEGADELYLQAREQLIEEHFEQALVLFRRVVEEYGRSSRADDAQYYLGYTLERLGRATEAVAAYQLLLDRWPDSSRAESARDHLLDLAGEQAGGGERINLGVLLDTHTAWEFRRDVAMAMARQGDLAGAAVLEEIMRRESSSRQQELIRILGAHLENPEARRLIGLGCEAVHSSSTQLVALRTLRPVAAQTDVLMSVREAITRNNSSSVQIEAIQTLTPHVDRPGVQRVMVEALAAGNTSSTQMAALRALRGYLLSAEVRPAVVRLFSRSESSSVQLEALQALEGDINRREAAEVLEAAAASRNSSSVQQQALRLAAASSVETVRGVARVGLAGHNSSSVQLEAVRVLAGTRDDESAARALEELLNNRSISSSVLIEALRALRQHLRTEAAPRAAAAALANQNSSSVQLEALDVAALLLPAEPVLRALDRLLASGGTSSSVQLKAIMVLGAHVDQDLATELIGRSINRTNSSSVKLAAIEALEPARDRPGVRAIILQGLDPVHSSSVCLAAVRTLEDHVGGDAAVRDAFTGAMRDRNMSTTVRVRCAEALLPRAGDALKRQIVEAMEDVIERRWENLRRNRFRYDDDVLEDALAIVRSIDPERARVLERRYGPPPTLLERIFGSGKGTGDPFP